MRETHRAEYLNGRRFEAADTQKKFQLGNPAFRTPYALENIREIDRLQPAFPVALPYAACPALANHPLNQTADKRAVLLA